MGRLGRELYNTSRLAYAISVSCGASMTENAFSSFDIDLYHLQPDNALQNTLPIRM